ncbi:MAG: CpcT/CpeT family chromophore lyase [Oceanicaulis sp.]
MRAAALLVAALALAACGHDPDPVPGAPDAALQSEAGEVFYNPVARAGEPSERGEAGRLVADMAGLWSNQTQYDAAPDALKREPAAGAPYDWLDLQYAQFHPVRAPQIGDHVVYLEWRSGAADGPVSRQRLWAFRENAEGGLAGMDFYTFRDPAPFEGRGGEAGAFEQVSPEDLIAYPYGCTLTARVPAWDGHAFDVAPEDCVITARSGRRMGIRADVEIAPWRIGYSEAGLLEDGSYAFLVPGGDAYEFRRVEP